MQKDQLKLETRRHFFRECGVGVGAMALSSILGRSSTANDAASNPMTQARAKRVIYMFMAGGPSQLELFDHKPLLTELHGKPTPSEFMKDKRFAFLKGTEKLLRPYRPFQQHGQSGAWLSDLLPHHLSCIRISLHKNITRVYF